MRADFSRFQQWKQLMNAKTTRKSQLRSSVVSVQKTEGRAGRSPESPNCFVSFAARWVSGANNDIEDPLPIGPGIRAAGFALLRRFILRKRSGEFWIASAYPGRHRLQPRHGMRRTGSFLSDK